MTSGGLFTVCLWGVLGCAVAQAATLAAPDAVVVNAQALSPGEVRALEQRFAIRTQAGRYWYGTVSGAWGFERGPTLGFVPAGLRLGGRLRADASGGGTNVFINGRELHPLDVWSLSQLGPSVRGRWWVDAQGTFGPEGGPALGNLLLRAQMRAQQQSPWGGSTRDGRHFLGRDSNGCMYYQGSNLVGGATTYAPSGC